ncbi:glycosyltransferase family 2 protein [Arundinibacter roseus]|uniref:Glycosyltransferase family 2 protein n=1 Tax=Arundinibacter roseus TaxID=2070510 RepID=A0A4R4KRB7_9BACT|nr:glycosyltransferase family 2 protein [Arundinibacter roseus]TDB68961.1 glycosyltransferase family 2 protein [Arundinibacter roseus]
MISVALCTYNGENYLPEQLESILQQSLPIDEIVVCDDGSTDGTLVLLQKFASQVNFPIRIVQNETNLGSTRNFEKCLSLCSGEIIFLCDQDDVWRVDKVEKQVDYLQTHPEIDAVFSNAQVINDDSQPTGSTIWQEVEFTESSQRRWKAGKAHEILFGGFVVTGATLALRRSCLARLTPFPLHIPTLIHDAWIALALSLEKKIDFIAEPLISYRMHASQQVGFGAKTDPVRFSDRFRRDRAEKLTPILEKADHAQNMYALLRELPFVPHEKLVKLYLRQRHFRRRATLPDNRLQRLPGVMKEVVSGRYLFSSKDWWLPALGDIFE